MDEELSGLEPGDTAATRDGGLAERLIREEFSDATAAHRVRGHRETPAEGPALEGSSADDATAEVPAVAAVAADDTMMLSAPVIHQEFAQPGRAIRLRSHRAGMLAGLGVVGALLAVLVVLAPGGSKPHLPAQSVHDVSPISSSGPRTAAATTPSTAAATTTSSAPAAGPTTTQPQQHETISTFITYSLVPGATTPAPTPTTTAPAETTAPPATTTTTAPPPQTTTTTTKPCRVLLVLQC